MKGLKKIDIVSAVFKELKLLQKQRAQIQVSKHKKRIKTHKYQIHLFFFSC